MPFSAANPPLQPAPEPHRAQVRRRAPSPPRPIGRGRGGTYPVGRYPVGRGRSGPYVPPAIPSEASALVRPFQRARNLFADFMPNSPPSPPPMVRTFPGPLAVVTSQPPPQPSRTSSPQPPRTPSPPLAVMPPTRTPSPDIFLELYQHGRHPVDDRSHLSIIPSWAIKAEKEEKGECIVCYGEQEHLQIRCQNCGTMRVCCICVVGIYQSINPCLVCRFRGGDIRGPAVPSSS